MRYGPLHPLQLYKYRVYWGIDNLSKNEKEFKASLLRIRKDALSLQQWSEYMCGVPSRVEKEEPGVYE